MFYIGMLNGYEDLAILINIYENIVFTHNVKVNSILIGLYEYGFVKFKHYKTTKEIWDKLKNNYECNSKVKKEKLQVYKM